MEIVEEVNTNDPGLRSYYVNKIEELQLLILEKQQNLERLKAQRNELNTRVRSIREELVELHEPGSYIGEVVKPMGKSKVLVKCNPDGKYVVDLDKDIDINKCTPNTRVALRSDSYTLHKILPTKVDPLVSLMKVEKVPDSTYDMVGGLDKQIQEIKEVIELPIKHPELFEALGVAQPKGVLLYGPPGTGKTLLAKAIAGEAGVRFLYSSGSEFEEMFVGVGAKRVRELFQQANEESPCIIFIDEIDAVGRARGKGGVGGHDERENTLNQLLIEMDGFNTDQSVIMLAGTNRADMLDSALTRPGRFDRTIAVELPDIKGRKSIFDVHLKNIKLNGTVEEYSPRLAALTPGFSGADIANICNEAAIHAGRRNKKFVELEDFESATDRIIGGLESTKIISPEEKRIVAFHEAGHAVAGWYLEHANPLLKVTIVPRSKGSLGYAQYLPKEISLRTKEQVMDLVCMALAGRASELVHFGKYTTGASDDLNKVTQIIYQLVQVYGMNDKVGQLAFPQREGQWPQERAYSESTAQLMDEEVRDLADKAFKRTVELMEQYKEDVTRVAELLIQQETIDHSDIARLIGERKFSAGKEYDEFVATKKKIEVETTTTSTNEEKSSNESSSEGGVQVGLA
mmetsp:Transcript_13616/g.14154  ORF Transcript_13616/g.14154 Transcript_13616/m.14154 type:complete len:629 (-) Transcript_13616:105-1991(-)